MEFYCKKCNLPAEEDKEKSNENWKVFKTKCPKCGRRVDVRFK